MSFKDCIQTAVDTKRVSEKRAREAFAAYDRHFAEAIAEGMDEAAAGDHAADHATQAITEAKKNRRWERINEMRRAHELHTRLSSSNNVPEELDRVLMDLQNTHETAAGMIMSNLDRLLEKYKPKKGGFVVPTDNLDNIVRASYGDVRNAEAKEFADSIAEAEEYARQWANSLGAAIPENPNRRIPQSINERKVAAVTKERFIDDFKDAMDWDIVKYAGKTVPLAQREEVLGKIYDGIVTNGTAQKGTAQNVTPGLATRLNRERFFYYKSADDWLRLQKMYGEGNIYEQFLNSIDSMAKDISLLHVLGPNPNTMKEFVKREANARAGALDLAKPASGQKNQDKARRAVQTFEEGYQLHARYVPSMEGNVLMQTFAAVRQTAVNALLGGVFVPSIFGDLANAKVAARMVNLPDAKFIRDYVHNFSPTKENISAFVSDGIVYENAVSLIHMKSRYFGPMEGPNIVKRIGDITYRSTLVAHHTQVGRVTAFQQMMGVMTRLRDKTFDELPMAPYMSEMGITPEDWDIFRAQAVHNERGAEFIRPIDMAPEDRQVATKFSNLMYDYARLAIPSPTLRSRVAAGETVDPNTIRGQFLRSTTALMSFPIALHFNQLRRIAQVPGIRNKITLATQYFLWTSVAGMLITQTKALLQGQNLYSMDPTDSKFYTDFLPRSLLNAGSLGLLGDVVMNSVAMANGDYAPRSPVSGYFGDMAKVLKDLVPDAPNKHPGRDMIKFIEDNVPKAWYAKLVIDRSVKDTLLQETDPAAYQARKRAEKKHEEGYWWGAGKSPTAPKLDTVIGN